MQPYTPALLAVLLAVAVGAVVARPAVERPSRSVYPVGPGGGFLQPGGPFGGLGVGGNGYSNTGSQSQSQASSQSGAGAGGPALGGLGGNSYSQSSASSNANSFSGSGYFPFG